jgi:hypothetical protein
MTFDQKSTNWMLAEVSPTIASASAIMEKAAPKQAYNVLPRVLVQAS